MQSQKNELKQINDYMYSLKIKGENNKILYKIIKNNINSSHYDEETDSIFFSAENVKPLKNYILEQPNQKLSYGKCIKLIEELTNQLNELRILNYSFYGIDIDDILTIDNKFIFVSVNYLQPLENNNFVFYFPIKRPLFGNPEILNLTILPSKINYKCIFYSLALLVIFTLLHVDLSNIKSENELENIMHPIKNTKVYWFLKRCLKEDINSRLILLI